MKKQFTTIEEGIKSALKDLDANEVAEATKNYAGVAKQKLFLQMLAKERGIIFIINIL